MCFTRTRKLGARIAAGLLLAGLITWMSAQFTPPNTGGGGGAPTGAAYVLNTSNAGLTGAQVLANLTSGYLSVTTGTGVLSSSLLGTAALVNTGSTGATVRLNNTASAYPSVTDASPIAWSLASSTVTNGVVVLNHATSTRALNLTNLVNGGFYTLLVEQDGTGGALMTLGSGCTWKVVNGGSGAIVLSAAPNAIDILSFTYDGANCYAVLGSNFN
jgi:hypothetical protein